jgi:aminotransferase
MKMLNYALYMDDIIEAMSIKYNNKVYEMKQAGQDVITLSYGEAYFDIPLHGFSDLPFPALYHYSHSRGIMGLRTKLCDYYLDHYGVKVDPADEMIITAGSKIAIYMSLLAILNPGDEVIVIEPTWVSYTEQIKLCHASPVLVPYGERLSEIERYISPKTRAIIICNPNNPSGYCINGHEMTFLHTLAQKHNLYILSDEAYSDYFLDAKDFISVGVHDAGKEHSIICNSLSKNFGISGWRLGYVITNRSLLNQILKIHQHLVTCPATILEFYIDKHFAEIIELTDRQIKDVVEKRLAVKQEMDRLQLGCMAGDATFYIFLSIEHSSLDSEAFCTRLLEEYKVSTVPGIGYGRSCDKFIRISVGNEPMDRIVRGLTSIARLIEITPPAASSQVLSPKNLVNPLFSARG